MSSELQNQQIIENAVRQSVGIVGEWKRRAKRLRIYRASLVAALIFSIAALIWVTLYTVDNRIPSTLYIRVGEKQKISFNIPATGEVRAASGQQRSNIPQGAVTIDLSGPVTMYTGALEHYDMQVRLFGFLPLKRVDIHVIQDQELIPMGIPVGIYMHSDGVLVVGVAEFSAEDGKMVSPAKNILKSGDYVKQVNGQAVNSKQELIDAIETCGGGEVTLLVNRGGQEETLRLQPQKNALGQYKAGIWIRDNVQGVGTLTYMDASGNFGALGHGIADVDTGLLLEVDGGTLYESEIVQVKKGEDGNPGEMTGRIVYADTYALGEISANSSNGIFGTYNERLAQAASAAPMHIALKQEIEIGPAEILCTVEEETRSFRVEITKVHLNQDAVNRGIELKVTDPELLELTGGIIQGMSGSPIIQNNKIVGAVTHVLVQDSTRGYGIFIENMLQQ